MNYLSPYTDVLGLRKAKHLLRRVSSHYSKETIDEFSNITPEEAFDRLIVTQPNAQLEPYDPFPEDNPDGNWTSSPKLPEEFGEHFRKRIIVSGWWWYNSLKAVSLKHKMTLFLHTSFTINKDGGVSGLSNHFFDHVRLLEFYALGNLKTLSKKITFDNAMLKYLDNDANNARNPNENYAREFLELFTILKGKQRGPNDYTNFTEHDVQLTARVFSGIKAQQDRKNIDPETNIPVGFVDVSNHDINNKEFSHAFDNHIITGRDTEDGIKEELSDFVEMLFDKEATAISFVRKLHRFFVKSEWEDDVEEHVIVPLAKELKENNYEVLPTLKTLFTSKYFYDADDTIPTDEVIGSIVKSPMQLLNEAVTFFKLDVPTPEDNIIGNYYFNIFVHNYYLPAAGMRPWAPDFVAGYPGYYQGPAYDRHWFSSHTLLPRYKMIESLISGRNKVIYNSVIHANIDIVDYVKNNTDNPSVARDLVSELATYLYPESIDDERVGYFVQNLLDGFADYYWTDAWLAYINTGDDTVVRSRLEALTIRMINSPEFQLM